MRQINKVIVHCSATKPSMDVDADWIRNIHVNENGWSDIGYHVVVLRDGTMEAGRPLAIAGAHCRGHNSDSIGICLVGGMSEEGEAEFNYTDVQLNSLQRLLLKQLHDHPLSTLHGHNEFSEKTCPNFNVMAWYDGE